MQGQPGSLFGLIRYLFRPVQDNMTLRPLFAACAAFLLSACSPAGALNLLVPTDGYSIKRDIPYGAGARRTLDIYVPDNVQAKAPVVLFFYGGSWQTGAKGDYKAFGQAMAIKGFIAVVADYRVYPETKYPGFVEDGASALAFVQKNIAAHGGDPKRIYLAGHSAGAYIAVMLAANRQFAKDAGADPNVAGVIGIAGPYDFLPLQDDTLVTIFGGRNVRATQPIDYVDGKRPPMLLAHGTGDTTVLPRNSRNLAAKLRGFDSPVKVVEYKDVGHVGIILSLAPGFRGKTTLLEDMTRFIRDTP